MTLILKQSVHFRCGNLASSFGNLENFCHKKSHLDISVALKCWARQRQICFGGLTLFSLRIWNQIILCRKRVRVGRADCIRFCSSQKVKFQFIHHCSMHTHYPSLTVRSGNLSYLSQFKFYKLSLIL